MHVLSSSQFDPFSNLRRCRGSSNLFLAIRYRTARCLIFVTSCSEGNLCAHRECVELGAGISAVGRADLLGDVAVQVVKHETHVGIDVPVQTRSIDCLPSTGHAICG